MFYSHIKPNDPFCLILTDDNLKDKQGSSSNNSWEIQLDRGELGGISLYSTLALQALGIRITPIISLQSENRININQYHQAPIIKSICTNYAKIVAEVFPEIEVEFEYWIPDSGSICGLVKINNNTTSPIDGSLQFIVNLKPFSGGEFITGQQLDRNYYLTGKTQNIAPVFYLSGSTQQGKFGNSSIESHYNINPGGKQKFEWSLAFLENQSSSINAISNINFEEFDKQVARTQISNFSNRFLIESGDSDWDKVFLSSQKAANQLSVMASLKNDKRYLVDSLHPEKSIFSSNGSSQEISDGITPLQLWYFSQVLPSQTKLMEDGLSEFLDAQKEDGFIPNHTSQINPQARFHAFPILAKIAYEILILSENKEKTRVILGKLINYLKKWITVQNTGESPHWENPMQTLYEDLPIHNFYSEKNNPIHSRWINSPFLNTLLHQECDFCLKLAKLYSIELPELNWLEAQKTFLLEQIQNAWNSKLGIFQYRDIQSNRTTRKKKINKVQESGIYLLDQKLINPSRLTIRFNIEKGLSRNVRLTISGTLNDHEIEESISSRQIFWGSNSGFATSELLYDRLTKLEIIHLPKGNTVEISTSNYSQVDLTNYLPICIKAIDTKQKDKLITNWLIKEFLSPYGLPMVPKKSQTKLENSQNVVDFPLNSLIIDALIKNNNNELALTLFQNLMEAATLNLRNLKNFYKLYDADDGSCTGEYNIINGMVPLKLFFSLLGIIHWTENEIEITGKNFSQNEVTIHFRGIKMVCSKDGYTIFTSGGKSLELKENKNYKIKIPN